MIAGLGYPNDAGHNAYFDDEIDASLPEDHPRRLLVRSAQKAVAMDLLPADFAPRAVYESEEITRFVAAVLEAGDARLLSGPLFPAPRPADRWHDAADELGADLHR